MHADQVKVFILNPWPPFCVWPLSSFRNVSVPSCPPGHVRYCLQGEEQADGQPGGTEGDPTGARGGCTMHSHQRRYECSASVVKQLLDLLQILVFQLIAGLVSLSFKNGNLQFFSTPFTSNLMVSPFTIFKSMLSLNWKQMFKCFYTWVVVWNYLTVLVVMSDRVCSDGMALSECSENCAFFSMKGTSSCQKIEYCDCLKGEHFI